MGHAKVRLIAIRHGETEWNLQLRETGQLDSPLTQRGIDQAKRLARRLATIPPNAIYSSDLGRAIQTAEIIAAECKTIIELEPGLRERNMGIFQGLTLDEICQRFPRERAEYLKLDPEYAVPDGETARERLDRSVRVFTAIAERHSNEVVAVVTHGGILTGFFEFVFDLSHGNGRRFAKSNCAYNAFEYSDGRWRLETWNDTSHL